MYIYSNNLCCSNNSVKIHVKESGLDSGKHVFFLKDTRNVVSQCTLFLLFLRHKKTQTQHVDNPS